MALNFEKITKTIFTISVFAIAVSLSAIVFCFILAFQPSDEQVFAGNIHKTVEIRISNNGLVQGYGTGVFVSNDGKILTNKHIVQDSITGEKWGTIEVRLASENEFVQATIMQISSQYDLAIIKINKENCQHFAINQAPKNGQKIFTIGNPNGFGLTFTAGNISSTQKEVIYNEQTILAMQVSLAINEGNSGGAVFTQGGEMVGLISFRLKDKNGTPLNGIAFAVPASLISEFLSHIG